MSIARHGIRPSAQLAAAILAVATLGACTEGGEVSFLQPKDRGGAESTASSDTKPTKLIERDVEAPEVFNAQEAGLWDGRPSLGGVWIAHPDVKDPERVTIRNAANGKEVIGALFRRERDIPGPRLQASSDAAVALGMLAGAPVKLEVVALRREEIAPEPVVAEAPAETAEPEVAVAETVPEAQQVAEARLDPIAGAAAAIEASEETGTAATPDTKPKRKGFGLFKRRATPEETAGAEALPPAAEVAEAELAPEADAAATKDPAPRKRFSLFKRRDRAEDTRTTALLEDPDAQTPEAAPRLGDEKSDAQAEAIAAAVAEAAPQDTATRAKPRLFGGLFARKPRASEEVGPPLSALAPDEVRTASIESTPLPKAAPTPSPRKSPLARPYIQIGIFSVEENATNTARQMRSNGVVPTVFEQTSGGKTFWRVVVGPARSSSERSALLRKIKGIGFSDAYAVTN